MKLELSMNPKRVRFPGLHRFAKTGAAYAAATAFLLLLAFPPSAQAANVDSLEQVLRTGKLSNEERLQLYRDLYAAYRNIDFRKGIPYLQEGLALARKVKNKPMQMKFFNNMGDAWLHENKQDSAIYFFEQSLRLAQELDDKRVENLAYMSIGVIYYTKGMFSQALQYLLETLSYFEKLENEKLVTAVLYGYIGSVYVQLPNEEQALLYLSKAESLYREIGDKSRLASVVIIKSQLLLAAFGEAILEDKAAMGSLIASVRQELEIAKEFNDRENQLIAHGVLGKLYLKMDDYTNAQVCIDSGLLLEETAISSQSQYLYGLQSSLYYQQGKYAECEEIALKLLAMDSTHVRAMFDMTRNVIMSNIRMGKAERAEKCFKEYWVKIKEYMAKDYQKNISEMEVKYETEKKELRIAALEKERALYLYLGLAAAAILLLALLVMLLWIKRVKKERQLVAIRSVLDGETAERGRLARDLHDGLGGMLSVVKLNLGEMKNGAYLPPEEVERFDCALNLLDDSIAELRRVAHNMMPGSLARSGLKVSLTDFCNSISGVEFQYLGAASRLEPKLEVMVYRTVHELVNNALRHANAAHILVQIIEEGNRFSLVVQDDGQGFDPKVVTPGIGLKNIRNRVAANNGHLEINSEKGKGTEISVEFKI